MKTCFLQYQEQNIDYTCKNQLKASKTLSQKIRKTVVSSLFWKINIDGMC